MVASRVGISSDRDAATGGGRAFVQATAGSQAAGSQQAAATPALTLDRVIGETCLHNSALAVNPVTGDVAYPAGCVVVIYQPRRNRQFRYFRASKTVSCLAFSRDGGMLAVGERGHQPAVTVWALATGTVLRELTGAHRFGIGCVLFTPGGNRVVTMGFKHDRMLRVWDLRLEAEAVKIGSQSPDDEGSLFSSFQVDVFALDPNALPPPPGNGRAPGAPATAPRREGEDARELACVRVPQRVRSMDFTSDGRCLVTCGDRFVKFWTMPEELHSPEGVVDEGDGDGPGCSSAPSEKRNAKGQSDPNEGCVPVALEGRLAIIVEELQDESFIDVACGKGGEAVGGEGEGGAGDMVFCVTAGGVLCSFCRDGVLQRWVALEVPSAYGLSLHDDTLAAACADGLVRLFRACDLNYTATLPRPPPLGHANIASVRELHDLAEAAVGVAGGREVATSALKECQPSAVKGGVIEPEIIKNAGDERPPGEQQGLNTSVSGRIVSRPGGQVGERRVGAKGLLRYPAVLGCRLSPSGTKVVCVYADRGLFIWDITDPRCVGKYRSFLAHGACIWDVQRIPVRLPLSERVGRTDAHPVDANGQALPDIPDGAMVTCSADNTVRLWDLNALDSSRGGGEGHSGRWSNIYSKHLLRVLYTDDYSTVIPAGDNNNSGRPESTISRIVDPSNPGCSATVDSDAKGKGVSEDYVSLQGRPRALAKSSSAKSCRGMDGHDPVGTEAGDDVARRTEEAAAAETLLSQGSFDPEFPAKPDWSCAPRSLAVHPDGLQVACGDKCGNIRVYDLAEMELAHTQAAHDAEVLCLAFSPILVPIPLTPLPAAGAPSSSSPSNGTVNRDTSNAGGEKKGARSGGGTGAEALMAPSQRWRAIDPLDPGAREDLAHARGDGDSSSSSTTTSSSCSSSSNSSSVQGVDNVDHGGGKGSSVLVLLASASRDRLVHIFDASANPTITAAGGMAKVAESSRDYVSTGRRPAAAARCRYPLLKTLDNHSSSVTAVKFSKDGQRLVSTGGDKMLVLNNVRGPHVHRFKSVSVPQGTIFGLDVDPTNKYMVTAGQDKRLNIWSIATGRHVRGYKVENPAGSPTPAAAAAAGGAGVVGMSGGGAGGGGGRGGGELLKVDLDPTGMYAAACSFDKWIRLFDFYSGKCLAKVAGHSELATGVRFTPDGRRLVSTGGDGVMFVWRLSSALQQAMRDRMSELRTSGNSGYRAGESSPGVASGTPDVPLSSDRGRPTTGIPPSAVGGGGDAGTGPQTPAKVAEARAKAKAEAKARLRFQRYQLPAWAQTLQPNPVPTTNTTTATATAAGSEGLQTPTHPEKHSQVTPPAGSDDNEVAITPPAPPTRTEEREVGKLSAMRSVASGADLAIGAGGSFGSQQPEPAGENSQGRGNVRGAVLRQKDAEGGYVECSKASDGSTGYKTGSGIEGGSANGGLSAIGQVGQGMVGHAVGRGFGLRAGRRVAAAGAAVPQGRWGQRVLQEGPLEILGRRLGHRPFPETLPPSQQRIGAAGDLVQSREEEDGVMLGGSDEEDENDGYFDDRDLEDIGGPRKQQHQELGNVSPGMVSGPVVASCSAKTGEDLVSANEEGLRKAVRSGKRYPWDDDDMDMADFVLEVTAGEYNAGTNTDGQLKQQEERGQEHGNHSDDDSPLRQSHGQEFSLGLNNRRRRSRSQQSFECIVGDGDGGGGSLESAGEQEDEGDFCANSPGSENAPGINHDDLAGMRGRRIIETEGAVENMRRRLSAMGLLEPTAVAVGGGAGAAVVEGEGRAHDNPGMDRAIADNVVATETAVPAENRPGNETSEAPSIGGHSHSIADSAPAGHSGISRTSGTSVAERKNQKIATNLFSVETETERNTTKKYATPVSACTGLTGLTKSYSPFKTPTPGETPRQSAIIIPASLAAGEPEGRRRIWSRQPEEVVSQRSAGEVTPVIGALPRPDEEYETALLRLSAAAEHAAQLYRELTQVAAAAAARDPAQSSLSVPPVSAEGTSRAVVGMDSFECTGAAAATSAAGVAPILCEGQEVRETAIASPAVVTAAAAMAQSRNAWDQEYQAHHVMDDDENADHRADDNSREREEALERTEPLLESYRESFASVNDILSVLSAGSASDRPDRTPKYARGTATRTSTAEPKGSQTSASPTRARRAWAPTPSTSRGSGDGGDLHDKRSGSWSLVDGNGQMRAALGLSSWEGGSGNTGSASMDESVPAEVAGMLQRYSEMMLRAVQEKIDASLADGTLRSSSTRGSEQRLS